MLTAKQIRWAHLRVEQPEASGTSISKQAGYSEVVAAQMASENIRNPKILEAMEERKAQLAAEACVTPGLVIREWLRIATADPGEVVSLKVRRCPECWPLSDADLPPNPKCATCDGRGKRTLLLADTDRLSPAARRLIVSYKETKDGIEVKLRDQDAALRNLADYLGMQNKSKAEHSGPGGGPITLMPVSADDLTDDQLAAIAAQALPAGNGNLLEESANLGIDAGVCIEGEPLTLGIAGG